MGRRLKCLDDYADLCSMLERWVTYTMRSVTNSLGYPRKSLDFSFVHSPASSIDPTGCSIEDHRDLEMALEALAEKKPEFSAAVRMYYMPWIVPNLTVLGYPFAPDQTYYNRLKGGHSWLKDYMRTTVIARKIKQETA